MFETVKNCFLKDMIDVTTGLANAVKFGWITEQQKQELIELKEQNKKEAKTEVNEESLLPEH